MRIRSIFALVMALAMLCGCAATPTATPESPAPEAAQPVETPAESTASTPPEQTPPAADATPTVPEGAHLLMLSDDGITLDGAVLGSEGDVYTAHDILYYEDRDCYDSGNPYGAGNAADRHSAEEAAAHTVVHIGAPGTYVVSGTLSAGQLLIDLGSEAKTDPTAVVTLTLDNADITCTVAPAVLFYNVYECDTAWVQDPDAYTPSPEQDLSAAGARVVLADGSVSTVRGAYVAKIYQDAEGEKKLHKYDGAFYSRMSMTIDGTDGRLNIIAANEGLDTELHLAINGGYLSIQSQDDGINTNEDGVSTTTMNGGTLHIVAGLGSEGDGIDSNGYLTVNGGVVISIAKPQSDSGLDSDMGSFINGGWVVATGSTMDWPESDSDQVTLNLQFAQAQSSTDALIVTDTEGKVIFAYDPERDETTGSYSRGYQGAVLSCPDFRIGETYHLYVGGDVQGTDVDGLYDPASVTGFDGAVQQQYTGTDVRAFGKPGGFRGEMTPPDGTDGRSTATPDGSESRGDGMLMDPPEGFQDHEHGVMTPPDGSDGMPEPPEGFKDRPGRGEQPDFPGGSSGEISEVEPSTAFFLQDQVNAFSGITAAK